MAEKKEKKSENTDEKKEDKIFEGQRCTEKNPFTAVPASLGGMLFVIVLAILIFSPTNMVHIGTIAWSFVVLGAIAMILAYLSRKR